MVKWSKALSIIIFISLLITGCSAGQSGLFGTSRQNQPQPGTARLPEVHEKPKVGVLLAGGGLREATLNQSLQKILVQAAQTQDLDYLALKQGDLATDNDALDYLANNGYSLIIGVGGSELKAVQEAAAEYPDIMFAMFDQPIQGPNAVSLTYRQNEAAFLAGALAALTTKTNIVAIVEGAQIPELKGQETAFKNGVAYINTLEKRPVPVQVRVSYIGFFAKSFESPEKGRAVALAAIDAGADVIYHLASKSGQGVLAACAERGVKAIGSDYDQAALYPGVVLTSTVNDTEKSMAQILRDLLAGKLRPGARNLGLKEGAVGLVDLKNITPEEAKSLQNNPAGLAKLRVMKDSVPPDVVTKLNMIKNAIIAGKIAIQP